MLQLKNRSPLAALFAIFPDARGIDTLYTVVKGTFVLSPQVPLAETQAPPALADEYHGDPASSSLKQAAEMHLEKPFTDVLLVGQAWAPAGKPVPQGAVRVVVAERQKTALVFGDRTWRRGGGISAPEPFEKVPLTWERAYGGRHQIGPQGPILAEEANPVGLGFLGRRSPDELVNTPVPNIEDPAAPLHKLGDAPTPMGFGPIAPGWLSRRRFAGTYDASWQRGRAPYLPADYDARFLNVGSPGLIFDRHLQGGEPVQLLGLSAEGPLAFHLPRLQVAVQVQVGGSLEAPPVRLDTVCFDTEARLLTMVWRAAQPCDKKVLQVKEIGVEVQGLEAHTRGAAA